MAYTLKRLLVLLVALMAMVPFFVPYNSPLLFGFLPDLLWTTNFHDAYNAMTLPLLNGTYTGTSLLFWIPIVLFNLTFWGFLLITLVQIVLTGWTLVGRSERVRAWSRSLALTGLILAVVFFIAMYLLLVDVTLLMGGSQKLTIPAFMTQVFSRDLMLFIPTFILGHIWLDVVCYILILLFNRKPRTMRVSEQLALS